MFQIAINTTNDTDISCKCSNFVCFWSFVHYPLHVRNVRVYLNCHFLSDSEMTWAADHTEPGYKPDERYGDVTQRDTGHNIALSRVTQIWATATSHVNALSRHP